MCSKEQFQIKCCNIFCFPATNRENHFTMFKRFLQLEWKSFTRSASFGQSVGLKIFMAFIAVYFLFSFLLLGIGLYPLLKEFFPEKSPMVIVNNFVVIWLVSELFVRFMMQSLPIMNVRPMMINNIKRKEMIRFVLWKSLFSFYNILTPIVVIPFGIWCITKGDYSTIQIIAWIIAMLSLVASANYANFLLKKKFADNLKALIPYLVVAVALAGLEYFEVFKISTFIGELITWIFKYPFLTLIPVLIAYGLYRWNFNYLKHNFYLDSGLKGKTTKVETTDLSWTKRFGSIAPFLQLDLKLIWRNKRPKTTVWMSLLFLAYGLIFYPNPTYSVEMPAFMVFVGIFITGIFVINFGQFIPAWDSSYYSMMMSQNIPMRQYLDSKAGLMYFSIVVLALLSTPYVYFGVNILLLNLACAVYNAGVNVPLILYAGSFNKKRIDLEKSPVMNYQGTGAAQWILGFPLLLIPIILWYVVYKFVDQSFATLTLGVIGIIGLLLRNLFMEKIVKAYKAKKHTQISGFKQVG